MLGVVYVMYVEIVGLEYLAGVNLSWHPLLVWRETRCVCCQ